MSKKHGRKKRYSNRAFNIALEVIIVVSLIMIIATMVSSVTNKKNRKQEDATQRKTEEIITQDFQTQQIDKITGISEEQEITSGGEDGAEKEDAVVNDTDGLQVNEEQKDANTQSGQTQQKDTSETAELAETQQATDDVNAQDIISQSSITAEQVDVNGLSTEVLGWGQGVNFDDLNRPVGSLNYQDKYGTYQAYFIGDSNPVIYLTFDEGYEYGCTEEILDILKEKNVKAVFFVTLPYVKGNPELVRRMIDEGHQVGNHSVTHPSAGLPSQSIEQQKEEIMGCHNYVKENFGYEMHLFRYPAGKFSEQSLAIVNNCNYKSVFWSFAYLDYDVNNQPDEAESLQKLVDRLHPGAIYLLHAQSVTNTHILGSLIDRACEKGYSFELFQ